MSEAFANIRVRYADAPGPITEDDRFRLRLYTDGVRGACRLEARLTRPGVVRDALLTMAEVLASDLRFKASDRSDYLAYLLKQGKRATKELWEAQKRFLDSKYDQDAATSAPLDPVVTVGPDGLAIEVFSADESAYARLHLKAGAAYEAVEQTAGVTYLDFTPGLRAAVGQMRSYRDSVLELEPSPAGTERELRVPYRWVRALGQVQAASTLPAAVCELAPVDLYNVLLSLRLRRAKKSPRALRYELVPGQRPRLVLEPWDLVLEGEGGVYEGPQPQIVRTWGRRRLGVLARLLPHVQRARVHLVGPGLPAYYVLDLGDATLTLALSGWTDSGWAGIATFDLLVPGRVDEILAKQVLTTLAGEGGGMTLAQLAESCKRPPNEIRDAVLVHLQRGQVAHDLGAGRFVHRPLFAAPLDPDELRYRDQREESAHRLLATPDQVRLTHVHDLGAEGVRIEGEVEDKRAHRTYKASFTIDREGRTVDASCTSPAFRRAGLREGPTVPMIALRLAYARQQAELERARDTPEGRRLIRAETRTLLRRSQGQTTMYRLSLSDRQVTVRWGPHPERLRMQRLFFGSADEARDEYFRRLGECAARGFLDASQAEAI
ncbi:hypothetical protein [Haliangium sp.]|uniref:hypothetical protein n=1 Tax=Haliangium sp. TaxID=2663208 RepID=UPI003D0DC6B4